MPSSPPAPDAAPSARGAPWHRRTFAALSVANYRWFFFGQGVSLIGSWVRSTAQGWLVYSLTNDRFDLGLVTALGTIPLLLSPIFGRVAERADKRRVLQWLSAFAMLCSLALAWLSWTGTVRTWHVMVIAFLSGLEMAFELPVRQSFVVEMVGRRHFLNAIALNSALFNSARVTGPAVAGILMWKIGVPACFLVDGLSFLAVIAALALVRTDPAPREPGGARWIESMREGFRYVRDDRRTRTLLTLMGICGVFGWSYAALMPSFARDVLHLREREFGFLLTANGVGAALGALWVAGRPAESGLALRRQIFGCVWLFGGMLVVFSRTTAPWAAAAALALSGFGMIAFVSASNTLIQADVPDGLRGRVMGIWALVFGGSMPLGSLLLGWAARRIGSPDAILFGAAVVLVLSVAIYLRLPPPAAAPPPPRQNPPPIGA